MRAPNDRMFGRVPRDQPLGTFCLLSFKVELSVADGRGVVAVDSIVAEVAVHVDGHPLSIQIADENSIGGSSFKLPADVSLDGFDQSPMAGYVFAVLV